MDTKEIDGLEIPESSQGRIDWKAYLELYGHIPNRVMSVSLGNPTRNKSVIRTMFGQRFLLSRYGVGYHDQVPENLKLALYNIRHGSAHEAVHRWGIGGTDGTFFSHPKKGYPVRETQAFFEAAYPIGAACGAQLKLQMEPEGIDYLVTTKQLNLEGKRVLVTSGVDRIGLCHALEAQGATVLYGDLLFAKSINIVPSNPRVFKVLADLLLPTVICKDSIANLYPTGQKQKEGNAVAAKKISSVDIIAGDLLYIVTAALSDKVDLRGKIIIGNTLRKEDRELFRRKGVKTVITTSPALGDAGDQETFGANVHQAVFDHMISKRWPEEKVSSNKYRSLLKESDYRPQVIHLN